MKPVAALIAALGLAGPALAGGPTLPEPEPVIPTPVAPVPASADWSGFYAGGQLGYGDIDSNGAGLDGDGYLGGVHAGYRWDFGQFVAGAELDYDLTDIALGAAADTSLDSVGRIKLAGGAEFGRSLVYATAGWAYADAELAGASASDNGWFLGAGMGVAVSDTLVVGGEVLQHRFDDFDGTGTDLDATTVTARVSLRF